MVAHSRLHKALGDVSRRQLESSGNCSSKVSLSLSTQLGYTIRRGGDVLPLQRASVER